MLGHTGTTVTHDTAIQKRNFAFGKPAAVTARQCRVEHVFAINVQTMYLMSSPATKPYLTSLFSQSSEDALRVTMGRYLLYV